MILHLRQYSGGVGLHPCTFLASKLQVELENPACFYSLLFQVHQSALLEDGLNFPDDRALGCRSQHYYLIPGREKACRG